MGAELMRHRGAAVDGRQANALRHIAGARRAASLLSRACLVLSRACLVARACQPGPRCPRLIAGGPGDIEQAIVPLVRISTALTRPHKLRGSASVSSASATATRVPDADRRLQDRLC